MRKEKQEGGSVISGAVNKDGNGSAFGVSTEGSIFVGGGALSAYGSTGAVDCIAAPVCAEKIKIFAASDTEGKNESDYNEDSFGAYKYLKFARTEVLSVTVLPSSATVEKGKHCSLALSCRETVISIHRSHGKFPERPA